MTAGSRALVAALVLGLLASACGGAEAAEIRSGAPRAAADPAAAREAAVALDAFAADLYRALGGSSENLVISPYSVAVALAMTRAGAAGDTAREMDAVLHADLVRDLHAGFNAMEQALAKRPGRYTVGDTTLDLELATANRLWGQQGFAFEAAFLDQLASSYGAGMQIVDYRGKPEGARRTINDWVAARTRDRIRDLIPQGAVDQLTRLVLTNAIYLKASWLKRFDDAVPGPFYLADGRQTEARLMHLDEQLRYARGEGYQAVELPYAGGLAMLVLVPDTGRFAAFERGLDGGRLRAITDSLRGAQVGLWMPKFTFRSRAMLKDTLSGLGMATAFSDRANFSRITRQEPLTIDEVIHQAFIAVDEKGTEAAAATAVVMRVTSAPSTRVELRVDRPFVFAIRDLDTGAVLFMGRVLDPTK